MQRLTIERVTLISLFAMVMAMAVRVPLDTDTWWHIRSGEYTLTESFIYQDPFSYTRNDVVWINHSWGAQLIIYGVYQLFGDVGLGLYTGVLATTGMAFIYRVCAGNTYLRAFIVILGAAAAAIFWSPRPQMISFVFSCVMIYLLFQYKKQDIDRLWFIPPLMLVWGNMHAGFSIGFIFLAAMIAGEIAENLFNRNADGVIPLRGIGKLILISLLSAALIMVNPYTYRMLLVPFQTVGIDVLRDFIQEWQSPDFQNLAVLPFVLLLLGVLGAAGASNKRIGWTDFILVSGTAFLALTAGRNIAVFAVVATPILTIHLDALFNETGWTFYPARRVSALKGWINAVLLLLILAFAFGKVAYVLLPNVVDENQAMFLPVAAAAHINETKPDGMLFNSYNWGGYLLWALPDYPVFVDGRTDLYGDEFLQTWINAYTAEESWREIFEQYDVNLVVVEVGSPIADALSEEPDWSLSYEDDLAVIYQRDSES